MNNYYYHYYIYMLKTLSIPQMLIKFNKCRFVSGVMYIYSQTFPSDHLH